ncbi:solute carrier family 35 (UDP-sugar transporter), member A1/2/3 [[Emmonsia] crescens]|uniref:Solute carrier family 35 (UDP-sugar transporter), member A1/2/3 n=1 Tax=[Emmonsia] crescens TaxID=73230 RepID=A0A2B7ZBA9_9EURO|nr:solute carrier family 35 (UDP-sugar transporter), member A1/2/3 [Emmonsia crescens]
MPVVGGRRYLTSTAVFLNEVIKLAICLTVALYEVSKTIPPSMPVTSLFTNLSAAVFTGDSWKLAVPAGLYTLSNSLVYIGLSNLEAATFQVTYQLKLATAAIFGATLLRRSLSLGKWMALLLLVVGVFIVQLPHTDPNDIDDHRAHLHFPRSLEEWQNLGASTGRNLNQNLHKRSATYEGIEEDLMLGHPHMNGNIGLLATIGACIASGLAGVSFEKVLKDSATSTTSVWIRNVQLAVYSIFPSLFIGVVFLDGEKVARAGFFDGYNWVVWLVIGLQAVGGIATSYCISRAEHGLRNSATTVSIVLSTVGAMWAFDFRASGNIILGTILVLAATYIYTQLPHSNTPHQKHNRPPPIRIDNFEKLSGLGMGSSNRNNITSASSDADENSFNADSHLTPPNDFSIKLPTTPSLSESAALTTSRPGSPSHTRLKGSYFAQRGGG